MRLFGGQAADQLLLGEIKNENDARQTRHLLAASDEDRTDAAELILFKVIDHMTDVEASSKEVSFSDRCDEAIERLAHITDHGSPSIVALIGLIAINAKLLQARFAGVDSPAARIALTEATQEYCANKFRQCKVAGAVRAVYDPARAKTLFNVSPPNERKEEEESRAAERATWRSIDFSTLTYYKSGTTSFILTCSSEPKGMAKTEKSVLKCVLFPWNNLSAIATATEDYFKVYGPDQTKKELVVQPWASNSRWVLMPFQEGKTLYESITEFEDPSCRSDSKSPTIRNRVDWAFAVGELLLRKLYELAREEEVASQREERQHLDLSPGNIIVISSGQDRTPAELRFIDLGVNHLYSRQVGIPEHDDAAYVAPEIKNKRWSPVADVYSVGIIMIRIVCGYAPRDGRVPDEIWAISPALGRFFEDLVETDWRRRLLLTSYNPDKPFSFDELRRLLDYTGKKVEREPEINKSTTLRWVARLIPSSREPRTQFLQWRSNKKSPVLDAKQGSYLLLFVYISVISWWFIFADTAFFHIDDLAALHPLTLPRGAELAASIICFNQGLIGAKYYSSILANLTVRKIPGILATATEVSIRMMSFVALPIAIVSTMWKPWLWAWAITVGALEVVAVNWLMLVLAMRINRAGVKNGLSSAPMDPRLNASGFAQWWWTMLLYAIVLAVIALGLELHWMHDTGAYVFGLVVISVGIHYISKFVAAGPAVRGGLARAFCTGERMRILQFRDRVGDKPLEDWPPRLGKHRVRSFLGELRESAEALAGDE
jgi:hypothetical protein